MGQKLNPFSWAFLALVALVHSARAQEQIICTGAFDVVLILDSSGSVSTPDFNTMLSFARSFSSAFDFSVSRMGLVQFNNPAWVETRLTNNETIVTNILSNFSRRPSGGTCIGCGLTAAEGILEAREAQQVFILITDGEDTTSSDLAAIAASIKERRVTIYAIGVGNFDDAQLRQIVSPPANDNVFTFQSFDQFFNSTSDLLSSTCLSVTQVTPDQVCASSTSQEVVFNGLGFRNSSTLSCKFGDAQVEAVFVSEREVRCSPPSNIPPQTVVEVQVSVDGNSFTFSDVKFAVCDCGGGSEAECFVNGSLVAPSTMPAPTAAPSPDPSPPNQPREEVEEVDDDEGTPRSSERAKDSAASLLQASLALNLTCIVLLLSQWGR